MGPRAVFHKVLCGFVGLFLSARVGAAESDLCRSVNFEGNDYTVCVADLRKDVIQLFWKKGDGRPYGFLQAVPQRVDEHSGPLLFATNAGMFDPNYKPVGLYIENGREFTHVNTRSGSGNFHLKPNGVFFVAGDTLGVLETGAYLKQHLRPDLATQSGPMLVINGKLHPRFIHYGASRKRRSGVGTRDNRTAVFAVSDGEVSFQQFGRLFRDDLKCRNALFLDGGSVPSLYVPSMKTGANFLRIGPMIGAFARARETPVP
jgi:uncharacterized protein YigE (DUF2233 family)